MSDSRTTELREGLTEHGIEWRSGLEGVTFVGDWCFVEYDNGKLAATCEPVLTPEQAIAATMGNPINEATGKPFDFNKLANRLNGDKDATLRSGTLTPEQVREAIERHSAWVIGNNRCFHDGAYEEIADELNAERHVETCRSTTPDNSWCFSCSSCGRSFPRNELLKAHNHGEINYCPNCGAKVVG